MTKLEEVLAEEWGYWSYEGPHNGPSRNMAGASFCIGDLAEGDHECVGTMLGRDEDHAVVRANVAVLGKRALALVLKHELWDAATDICTECGNSCADGHAITCEWAAIVAAAKEIE